MRCGRRYGPFDSHNHHTTSADLVVLAGPKRMSMRMPMDVESGMRNTKWLSLEILEHGRITG